MGDVYGTWVSFYQWYHRYAHRGCCYRRGALPHVWYDNRWPYERRGAIWSGTGSFCHKPDARTNENFNRRCLEKAKYERTPVWHSPCKHECFIGRSLSGTLGQWRRNTGRSCSGDRDRVWRPVCWTDQDTLWLVLFLYGITGCQDSTIIEQGRNYRTSFFEGSDKQEKTECIRGNVPAFWFLWFWYH